MRLIALAAFAGLLTTAAHADTMKNCATAWQIMAPADKGEMTYKEWSAKCLKTGYKVGKTGDAPAGATAMCKDYTYSVSKTAKGRCSHHGGVAKVL